jgi:hypothetical protein
LNKNDWIWYNDDLNKNYDDLNKNYDDLNMNYDDLNTNDLIRMIWIMIDWIRIIGYLGFKSVIMLPVENNNDDDNDDW